MLTDIVFCLVIHLLMLAGSNSYRFYTPDLICTYLDVIAPISVVDKCSREITKCRSTEKNFGGDLGRIKQSFLIVLIMSIISPFALFKPTKRQEIMLENNIINANNLGTF